LLYQPGTFGACTFLMAAGMNTIKQKQIEPTTLVLLKMKQAAICIV